MILGFVVPTTEVSMKLPVGKEVVAWATGVVGTDTPERYAELSAGAGVGIMPNKRTSTAARYSNAANAEFARANGWVAQVRRLTQQDHDWFLITDAYSLIGTAEYEAAAQLLARAAQGASYRRQIDLVAFRYHDLESGIDQGRTGEGGPQPTRRGNAAGHRWRRLTASKEHDVLRRDRCGRQSSRGGPAASRSRA
jgi:hypothetical protein